MKKNSIYVLGLFITLFVSSCSSQNTCTIENYYLNSDIFSTDTTYNNVFIDGKSFRINILSNKLDENLEKINFSEDEFEDSSPKTIVIYDNSNGKIVYANKFDIDITTISLVKQNNDLSKEGKLYLHWMSSGGGSGFSSNTNLVSFKNGKIIISEIFESGELAYILFNKNDKEIYVIKGIWGHELDVNGHPIESHFSDHKYKILQYRFGYDGYEEKEIGITKNKYASLDEGKTAIDILRDIMVGEDFMPGNTIVNEYVVFDNFNGAIMAQ